MSTRTPYVVRFGPWARNLYLGLPAAFAFALIGYVSEMPWWFAAFWFGVIAVLVWFSAFPLETRIYDDRVVRMRRLLALVPIWRRTYALTRFDRIAAFDVEGGFTGDPVRSTTIHLVLKGGRHLAVQSYSAGADNQPPAKVLVPELVALTGLPFSS